MTGIRELLSTKSNGLIVKLFEYDVENEQAFGELKEYLIKKIKTSKVHNSEEFDLSYYGSKNLNPEFIQKFKERIDQISIPQKTKIPQFDVRRERVTEWMAQLLLEKAYGCRFYKEADKRMNIEPVNINKHTPGVDAPGIRIVDGKIKFVICEVKASEDKKIPCSSAVLLRNEIQNAIEDKENRLTKEILQYMNGIKNVKFKDEELQEIIEFLANLIVNSEQSVIDNVMFFPVLIRNNDTIIEKNDIDDYKDFIVSDIFDKNIENIIFAFRHPINDFSNNIYTEAIGNE